MRDAHPAESGARPVRRPGGGTGSGCRRSAASIARAGVTLLEMLAVVLILSVVAMASVPGLTGALREARLDAGAAAVVDALEFAQVRALGGQEMRVRVDAAGNMVEVLQGTTAVQTLFSQAIVAAVVVESVSNAPARDPLDKSRSYTLAFNSRPPYAGVDITAASFGGSNEVAFGTLGSPSATGSVVLAYGGQTRTIRLGAVVGNVSVSQP